MNKKIFTAVLLCLTAFSSFADLVSRNETVYVKLDAYGRPEVKEVVTYLATDGNGAVDSSNLYDIKNVTGKEQPSSDSKGNLVFTSSDKNIFYKGYTDGKLPVDIDVKYFLNDEEVPFDILNGKSGKVRIEVAFHNTVSVKRNVEYTEVGTGKKKYYNTYVYLPFLTMAATSFDVTNFSNISAPDGTVAVVGNNMKLTWLTQPLPDASFYVEVESENIIMPSITFQIVPKMIPLPEVDLYDSLNQIYNGVDQVGSLLLQLQDGASKLIDGQSQLTDGLAQIENGADLLGQAADAQKQMTEGVFKIESGIMDNIQDKTWMSQMKQLNDYLTVSTAILNMVINGGPIEPVVKEFLKQQGKEVPEIESFPGLVDSEKGLGSIEQGAKSAQDGSKKLHDGAALLQDSLGRLKAEGTEEIKSGIVSGSAELLKMLAVVREGKLLAASYNSFCGYDGNAESCVQFILKTPGVFSM